MAFTMSVIRLVLERSFRSRRQPLSTAMARSPMQRILTWLLLCRCFQRLSRRPRKGTRMSASDVVRIVRPALQSRGGERIDDPVGSGSRQVGR